MSASEAILIIGMCVVIPVFALLTAYLFRRQTSQERLRAIEKGVSIPFEVIDPRERAARTRRTGIVLIAVGVGTVGFFVIGYFAERDRDMLTALGLGLIPLLIGVGLLIDYRLRSRELDKAASGTPAETAMQ